MSRARRISDWLRLLAPLVVLVSFGLAAWKLGFLHSNQQQVEAATKRIAGYSLASGALAKSARRLVGSAI
jgi:hypothetical protein